MHSRCFGYVETSEIAGSSRLPARAGKIFGNRGLGYRWESRTTHWRVKRSKAAFQPRLGIARFGLMLRNASWNHVDRDSSSGREPRFLVV